MDEVIEEIIIRILVERIQQVVILAVVQASVSGITYAVLIAQSLSCPSSGFTTTTTPPVP